LSIPLLPGKACDAPVRLTQIMVRRGGNAKLPAGKANLLTYAPRNP